MSSREDRTLKGRRGRKKATRSLRKRFLIVCEGERTEPNYFNEFPIGPEVEVVGTGRNTDRVVRDAIGHLRRFKRQGLTFDEVWCVFDKDNFPDEVFNGAIRRI